METPPPLAQPASRPKWPTVIGVLSIVFGSGALLQSATSALGLLVVRAQMEGFAKQGADQGKIDEYLAQYKSFVTLSSISLSLLALLLLASGILLLRRRRIAAVLHQVWAILKILVGGFFLFKTQGMTRLQMSIMLDSPVMKGGPGGVKGNEMFEQFTSAAMWVGIGFGLVFLAIYPVFLIIWFNRERIRGEIRGW